VLRLRKWQQQPGLLRQVHSHQRHPERGHRERNNDSHHAQQHRIFDHDTSPLVGVHAAVPMQFHIPYSVGSIESLLKFDWPEHFPKTSSTRWNGPWTLARRSPRTWDRVGKSCRSDRNSLMDSGPFAAQSMRDPGWQQDWFLGHSPSSQVAAFANFCQPHHLNGTIESCRQVIYVNPKRTPHR